MVGLLELPHMSENRFIGALTILVFILIGLIGWHILSPEGGDREISIKKSASILNGSAPKDGAAAKESKVLGMRKSVSLVIASDHTRVAYYDAATGRAYEVGLDGSNEKTLSDTKLPNFLSTIWSPNKKEVISEFATTQGAKTFSYFNYISKKSSKLPTGISSVAFSPSGDRIAYFKQELDGVSGLFTSNPDGSAVQKIMSARMFGAEVFWPTKDFISLMSKDDNGISSLFSVSLDGKVTKVVSDKSRLSVKWGSDGKNLLASYLSEVGNRVSVVNSVDGSENILPINSDARSCAWGSKDSIVCVLDANKDGQPQAKGLYNIAIESGLITYLPGSSAAGNGVGEIIIDPTNSYVVFTTPWDGRIFSTKR